MANFRYGSHLHWHIDYKDAILRILLLHTGTLHHALIKDYFFNSSFKYFAV